jgi:hypothetical protein
VGNRTGKLGIKSVRSALQPCQAEVSRLAKILFREVFAHCEIGLPVAFASLFGFFARSILTAFAGEGKGGDLLQPGKPLLVPRVNTKYTPVARLEEFVGLSRG